MTPGAGTGAASRMGTEIAVCGSLDELGRAAAAWVADALRAESGVLALALAGGSTPRAFHGALAARGDVPFERLSLWFGDERCVSPDHPDSNYRMARESLIEPAGGAGRFAAVERLRGEERDADAEARRYEALLPDPLDLLVLGVGEDGHTASLFPFAPALTDLRRRVLAVTGDKPPPRRLTLAPQAIVSARRILVLAAGADKAPAVARALEGPCDVAATPAQLARTTDPGKRRTWVLDRAAAAGLHADWWRP